MPGLSDTISRLKKFSGTHALPGMPVPTDRLQDIDDFGANPGALRARVYVPETLSERPALVVVLHGCTQSAAGYDQGSGWSDLADRHGFILLFPEQRRANNHNLCFNWFVPAHTRRGQGEAHSISQMVNTVAARHGVDRARVYVTGLSAGGAMTSVMLATYPEMFAGGAIIAGLPYGVATSVPQAFEAMRGQLSDDRDALANMVRTASGHRGPWPTISIWHGSSDRTVDKRNAQAIVEQWQGLHGVSPNHSTTGDGRNVRRAWQNDAGIDVIEEYIIAGMGHGVPLSTSGEDGCGTSAAYMLEVGVSSTQEICKFWGLVDKVEKAKPSVQATQPKPVSNALAVVERPPSFEQSAQSEPKAAHRPAASNVQRIIEDALRSAGLMK